MIDKKKTQDIKDQEWFKRCCIDLTTNDTEITKITEGLQLYCSTKMAEIANNAKVILLHSIVTLGFINLYCVCKNKSYLICFFDSIFTGDC